MDVDLFLLCVPVDMGIQHTHPSVLELKLVDGEVGICLQSLSEDVPETRLSGGKTAEAYRVEVDEFEDIGDVDVP